MSKQIEQPKLLIGEGNDEVIFFQTILKHLNLTDIMVEAYQGKNNLSNYLKTLKVRPNFSQLTAIGITRDADDSIQSAFDSIKSSLQKINLSIPTNLGEKTNENPQISIYILPDNQNSGMLENLCLETVKDEPAMICVNEYFQCLKINSNTYPNNLAKAKIHAWLASREIPDKRLAEAAQAGYFDFNHSAFAKLKQFILSL